MRKLLLGLAGLLAGTAAQAVELNDTIFNVDLPGTVWRDLSGFNVDLPGTVRSDSSGSFDKPKFDYWVPFTLEYQSNSRRAGSGKLNVRVYEDQFGHLTFYWRVANNVGSIPITALELIGDPYKTFPGHSYDVDWRPDLAGTSAPDSLEVVHYSSGGGVFIFHFLNQPIMPGSTSKFFYMRTGATKMGKTRWTVSADTPKSTDYINSQVYYTGALGPLSK